MSQSLRPNARQLNVPQAFAQALELQRLGRLAEAERLYSTILADRPDHFDALHNLGMVKLAQGQPGEALRLIAGAMQARAPSPQILFNHGNVLNALNRPDEALASFDHAIKLKSKFAEAHNNRGAVLAGLGRTEEALESYRKALAANPNYIDALSNRGNALTQLRRFDEALASYDRALALRPDRAETHGNRGLTLHELRRFDEAVASCDRALALRPDYVEAHYNRGNALECLGRYEEALACFDCALALRPNLAEAHSNRGNALRELKRLDEALSSYDRALALRPNLVEAHCNRGVTLHELKRFDEALASFDRALTLRPDHAEAHCNRGVALHALKRFDEALASYDRALALRPSHAEALCSLGMVFHELKRLDEALSSYDRALALRPDYTQALFNRGVTLQELKRFDEAMAGFDRLLAIKPDHAHAFSAIASCAVNLCDWDRRERAAADLAAHIDGGTSVVSPFVTLGYSGDPALQRQCAAKFIANKIPSLPEPLWTDRTWRHDRMRIAYVSADFRTHATAFLMAELFEKHDRSRFETIGVSFGADDRSDMRQRLVAGFDEFHDVRTSSNTDIARLLHDRQVDIAIDLKGYTQESRPEIWAYRPAPIQASYLGYPGTMAAPFMDYIIADQVVAPFEHQPFYTEKIVQLPDCYQVNDRTRRIADQPQLRLEAGLPEHGFVFCSFNNNWKIAPGMFDVWMRLLNRVEGSVLWLLRDNDGAEQNLRKEARRRGVDPSRLVFAGRLSPDEHLARHRLADLFLDTLPYNAHTTASDALWAGLPVLTCKGEAFAGRVAASLLQAAGIPDLIAADLDEYQALALKLAGDPAFSADMKARLAHGRDTCPLFDTDRFARHIEAAYTTMWQAWQRGEAPRPFSVAPIA